MFGKSKDERIALLEDHILRLTKQLDNQGFVLKAWETRLNSLAAAEAPQADAPIDALKRAIWEMEKSGERVNHVFVKWAGSVKNPHIESLTIDSERR